MRELVGILGWLVAAVGVLLLAFSGFCVFFTISTERDIALLVALGAVVVFLIGRAIYRWGFSLDRSQGKSNPPPPSSGA